MAVVKTDAGRAVTTSAYGTVSTVLLQFLSVFHSHSSFSFHPSHAFILHCGSVIDNTVRKFTSIKSLSQVCITKKDSYIKAALVCQSVQRRNLLL